MRRASDPTTGGWRGSLFILPAPSPGAFSLISLFHADRLTDAVLTDLFWPSPAQVEVPPQPLYQLAIGLAGAGVIENGYLTFNKLAGLKPALCSAGEQIAAAHVAVNVSDVIRRYLVLLSTSSSSRGREREF